MSEKIKTTDSLKLTDKQTLVSKMVITYSNGVNVYELLQDHKEDLQKVGIKTDKINSANATLSSLASKGLVIKSKVAYNNKMVTNYKATDTLIKMFK